MVRSYTIVSSLFTESITHNCFVFLGLALRLKRLVVRVLGNLPCRSVGALASDDGLLARLLELAARLGVGQGVL